MPGLIPHLIAGFSLFSIGRLLLKSSLSDSQKIKEQTLLLFICVLTSVIPDIIFGIYYTTNLLSYDVLLPYHIKLHYILTPIFIIIFIFLTSINPKRKLIWIMGINAIIIHVVMDQFIEEEGFFF